MKKKRVTSFDVADSAGVSRSTVSLVLNDVKSITISDATRKRVIDAATRLKYVPHAAGQALASQKTRNIGFIYSESQSSHDFLLQFVNGLVVAANRYDLRLVTDMYRDGESFNELLTLTRSRHIDGLIMTEPSTSDPILHQLAEENFPAVLIGTLPTESLCSIDIDNILAAEMITNHLVSLGHNIIACITNAPPEFTAASSRLEGYRRALESAGLPYNESLVRYGGFTAESGYRTMMELLKHADTIPTAVFVASDIVAFGAMRGILDSGLKIPDQIAVAGFDNISLSAYASPPLTTIGFPVLDECLRAAEMLIELIDGRLEPGYHENIETELIIRQSTAGK